MPSKYRKKDAVDPPRLMTISRLEQENVAQEGQPAENKWVMYFAQAQQGLVLNSTNLQLCAQALGSDETDDWMGKRVVLYSDPNVSFGGKLVGGIRIRAPKKPPAPPAPPPPPPPLEDMDDDIPY